MKIAIRHLFEHPEHIPTVASWIYTEFWLGRTGYSVATFERRLRQATDPDSIPLSLLAFADGRPAGTVNLVQNDNERRPQLFPWLAALVVVPELRGCGLGTRLVRSLLGESKRLGLPQVFLGTDIPLFYSRLGAKLFEQLDDTLCIMRFSLNE